MESDDNSEELNITEASNALLDIPNNQTLVTPGQEKVLFLNI